MNFALAWLIVAAAPSVDCFDGLPEGFQPPVDTPGPDSPDPDTRAAAAGLMYSAAGFQHLQAAISAASARTAFTENRRAVTCLLEARRRLPRSAVVARDLATVWIRLERWAKASEAVAEARRLGAAGPEVELMAAVVAARRGRSSAALRAAAAEGTWRSDLIATRFGSSRSKDHLLALLPENTERATWGRLMLALAESRDGDLPAARQLASDAERDADGLGVSSLAVTARQLSHRLRHETPPWQGTLRLRTALEYPTNPGFSATGGEPDGVPVRLALSVSGGLRRSLGRWVLLGAARADQHLFISEREDVGRFDLFHWSVAAGVRYSLSSDPNGTALGIAGRVRDAYLDLFGERLGTSIEGGPELHVRVDANLHARLALYGLKSTFVVGSPPSGVLSPVDRDRTGQRMILTLRYRSAGLQVVGDAMFLRDQADGEAFDAIGGGVGVRVAVRAQPDLWLHGGLSGTVREYGPVGDAAVIGDAATRPELRTAASLGARWAFFPRLSLVVEDVLVTTAARDRHRYTDNVLTVGMESSW